MSPVYTVESLIANTVPVIVRPDLGPCREWAGSRDPRGYGQVTVPESLVPRSTPGKRPNRTISTSRLIYLLAHPDDDPPPDVRHRCDNPPCIDLGHLLSGTRADNSADMVDRGRVTQAVLTPEDVVEVRRLFSAGMTGTALGKRYGVSDSAIYRITRGAVWTRIGGPITRRRAGRQPRFTEDQVRAVRRAQADGKTHREITAAFGVGTGSIDHIVHRKGAYTQEVSDV